MSKHIQLLENLIRNAGVSAAPAKVTASMHTMHAYLQECGIPFLTFEQFGERTVLFAANRPGKVMDVILNAHLDVVPAEEYQFTPRIEGDRIYGRGSCDDLGNAVVAAETLRLMKDAPIGIGIIFTADEEIGGTTTAGMVERGYRAEKLAFVLDGNENAIVCREKGIAVFRCTAHGKSCHASTPWAGVNPIAMLMQAYCRLEKEFAKWPQASEADPWHLTMAPCCLGGGHADNQVPATAEILLNIRYTGQEELDRFYAMLRDAMGDEIYIDIEQTRSCQPVFCDENHPLMQMLMEELRRVLPGENPCFESMCGATDARHMVGWDVPIAITGIVGDGIHSNDEWTSLKSIDTYIAWLCASLQRLADGKF